MSPVSRIEFQSTSTQWGWSIAWLISLAMIGLNFLPGYPIAFFILADRFFRCREEFTVQMFILATVSGMYTEEAFPFKWCDIMLIGGVLAAAAFRFSRDVTRLLLATGIFIVAVLLLAMTSDEPMTVQIRLMRYYFLIAAFTIPLLLFRCRRFDIKRLLHYIVLYSLAMSIFYFIDGFILCGDVLVPCTPTAGGTPHNSIWNDLYWAPFTTYFPRKWPAGLFIWIIGAWVIATRYRLQAKWWIIIILGAIACRTMTFLAGVIIVYLIGIAPRVRLRRYIIPGVLSLVAIYYIDSATGSFLRVASTVDQFVDVRKAIDRNDLVEVAEFGSGRMAQAIPKFLMLIEQGRVLSGFGFLHPSQSAINTNLLYENEYYHDRSADNTLEMPTVIEITQLQTILQIGVIGLLVQTAFFISLYLIVRHYRMSRLYLAAITGVSVTGLGGFIGFIFPASLWVALALAITLLGGKETESHTGTFAS